MTQDEHGRNENFRLVTELKIAQMPSACTSQPRSIVDFAFCPDTGGRFILCLVQQEVEGPARPHNVSESSSEKEDNQHKNNKSREK